MLAAILTAISFFFSMNDNGLAVALRGQSASLSSLKYLSATESKCLLPTGRSCLAMV